MLEIASDWLRSPLGCWRYDMESPTCPGAAPVTSTGIFRELELLDITDEDTDVGEAGDNDLWGLMPSEDVQEADLEAAEDPDLDATEESPPQHELSEPELDGDETIGALYVQTMRSLLPVVPVASATPDEGCAT